MAEAAFDPEKIIGVLDKHGVDYVLIGGLAATIHGSHHVTFDADVTPRADHANLARLSAALRELGARVRVDGISDGLSFDHDSASLGRAELWNLTTTAGALDIAFRPAGTYGYEDLIKSAVQVTLYGAGVKVASLADLIRSKRAANRPKDRVVLPTLERILEETGGQTIGP